jgi:DNA-binding PadR family transcriptional regulator
MRSPDRTRDHTDHPHHSGHPGLGRDHAHRRNIRGLLLAALLAGPAHGYELMRRLEEHSGGRWRPSPGSVYPLLQMFEDEGLARSHDDEGRKTYALTAEGRARADEHDLHELTGQDDEAMQQHRLLHAEIKQLHLAARQVGMAGSSAQVERAADVVRGARQALYRLLADQ